MKRLFLMNLLIFAATFIFAVDAKAQSNTTGNTQQLPLKTYLIERDIPGAGQLTPEDLKAVSQKSCSVLKEMGPDIEWMQSYVTGNKIFCVYRATNETMLREHAKKGGFPVTAITEIKSTISPKTAE